MSALWLELLIVQTLIGYCFVIANFSIGLYNIRDLGNMKGDLTFVKAHKWIGRIETVFFYGIAAQCITMVIQAGITNPVFYNISGPVGLHAMIGGVLGTILFTFKAIIAYFKKDVIYKYGQFVGPIGFIGWSLPHWTNLYDYYTHAILVEPPVIGLVPTNFLFAAIIPIPIGLAIFLFVLVRRGSKEVEGRWSIHQIAFILHGITFGYEKASKELLGTPALFKYVVPKTYQFLEKLMESFGINLKELQKMNVNDAISLFTKKAAEIGMAEKIKIKWEDDKTFTVESVNCSTSKVRSSMSKSELTNAICPWAIMAASIINKSTGKDLEMESSEFNEIGAITRLHIKD